MLAGERAACQANLENERFTSETKMMSAEDEASKHNELQLTYANVKKTFNNLQSVQAKSLQLAQEV